MKKLFFAAIITLSLVNAACAVEDAVQVDGKKILIVAAGAGGGSSRVFHSKDLQDGIFIRATNGGTCANCGDDLPNAQAVIKELFVAHGFKVVDKAEGASLAIQFSATGSMNMVAANNKAAHSTLPSSGKVAASVGAIAAGVATGGIAAGVGYIAGAFWPTDEATNLWSFVSEKPEIKHGFFGGTGVASSIKGGDYINIAGATYRLEKESKAPDDAVLKMMTEQWIKCFMVLDTVGTPTVVAPASAVAAVETITEAKK